MLHFFVNEMYITKALVYTRRQRTNYKSIFRKNEKIHAYIITNDHVNGLRQPVLFIHHITEFYLIKILSPIIIIYFMIIYII